MKKAQVVSRSGRFSGGPSPVVAQFTESISFDWRLWRHDLQGSRAHARMLARIGILKSNELNAILRGLDKIETEISSGQFRWKPELEDVHMNIEADLTRRVPAGAKLHTGRSRNDQVAVDLRLWMRDEAKALLSELNELQRALVDFGARHLSLVVPGYTHLQRAQPVFFAHHWLAYVEMIERDRERFHDASQRANVCPLGSGALAGSTLPLDRAGVAKELGFVDEKGRPRLSRNSMDAVCDRDFVIEFCAAAALLAVHLSRLAEDMVLWTSAEFGFIIMDDAFTTGSSLMPQKRNPDVAELARGKSARAIGNLTALLVLLKGLPMTYNRDLQEDKERLFDSADTVRACIRLTTAMIQSCRANEARCQHAAADPTLLATDLADYLVRRGLPFRQAHHVVGTMVSFAEGMGKPLNKLTLEELRTVHPGFGPDVTNVFDLAQAMDRRSLLGAPGRKPLRAQLARWKKILAKRA